MIAQKICLCEVRSLSLRWNGPSSSNCLVAKLKMQRQIKIEMVKRQHVFQYMRNSEADVSALFT